MGTYEPEVTTLLVCSGVPLEAKYPHLTNCLQYLEASPAES